MGKQVEVSRLPFCDMCRDGQTLAKYDAKTTMGPWANMCEKHWKQYSLGTLGTGLGQELILAQPKEAKAPGMTVGDVLKFKHGK